MNSSEGATTIALRRLILALIFLSAGAMLVDLLLLEHFESAWQWTPLVLLVLVIAIERLRHDEEQAELEIIGGSATNPSSAAQPPSSRASPVRRAPT